MNLKELEMRRNASDDQGFANDGNVGGKATERPATRPRHSWAWTPRHSHYDWMDLHSPCFFFSQYIA